MTPHRTKRAALQAYRRFLERLEADAARFAEIALEHQADLAVHLPPEEDLDRQLDGGETDLLVNLWGGIDGLTLKLAGLVAVARQARGLRRPQRAGSAPDAMAASLWEDLREAARRRAELRAPRVLEVAAQSVPQESGARTGAESDAGSDEPLAPLPGVETRTVELAQSFA